MRLEAAHRNAGFPGIAVIWPRVAGQRRERAFRPKNFIIARFQAGSSRRSGGRACQARRVWKIENRRRGSRLARDERRGCT
jgi:hypothetical protein